MSDPVDAKLARDVTQSTRPHSKLSPGRQLIWFGLVTVALLLIAFAKVPAYDYGRGGLDPVSRTIRDLWWTQIRGLPDAAYGGLLITLFIGLILVFLVGSAAMVWYSLYPSDPPSAAPAVDEAASTS